MATPSTVSATILGNKLDFLKTNVIFALEREDLGDKMREFILETAEKIKAEEAAPAREPEPVIKLA